MIRQYWKPAVAVVAALVLGVGATIFAYGRSHPAQVALIHATPTGQASLGPLYVPAPGGPLPTPYAGASPILPAYSSPYGYVQNPYGNVVQRGYGIGPPHAGSTADIGYQPGCDESSTASGYGSGAGPCGTGAYRSCMYDPSSLVCNQQLNSGTICGYGAVGCIPVQLACRLPIFGGSPGSGGFISLPKGDFTSDPASNVSLPGAAGYASGETYDRSLSKWLPVQPSWVSPDGRTYTYPDQSGAIHSVDVASGTNTVLTTTGSWQPLRYATEGIYAIQNGGQNGPTPGLWLVTAAIPPRQITASGYWNFVGGGAAYGNLSASYPSGASNDIRRLDLNTLSSTPWFQRPGYSSTVMGVDLNGYTIIQATPNTQYVQPELWLGVGAESGIKLLEGFPTYWPTLSDNKGLWLTVNAQYTQGILLLTIVTDSNGIAHPIFDKVSSVAGQIAGDCAS